MKIFETGPIPVHIALTQVFEEDDLELSVDRNLKREIEDCYKQYTPAQCILFTSMDADQIQHESEMSWDDYFHAEFCKEVDQWYYEDDDTHVIRAYLEDSDDSDDVVIALHPHQPAATRRKQTRKHNKRLRSIVMFHSKDFDDDCHYKAIINRRIVSSPKSKSLRFAKLLKQAEKMKLVTRSELFAS